ncbi:MAG TPA: hypothetical protein VFK39_04335 [Gemmatimonadaceae bacterium]|jgi:hypothetical protein|nr:hypothetical protein [Gemmatimonadaceae bacterium]
MDRVEELVTMRASAARGLDLLLDIQNLRRWVAPDVSVTPFTLAKRLGPGDRFRVRVLGPLMFDYTVEGVSEREVALAFTGPWIGSERWSFIADGADTIVRRVHEVRVSSLAGALAWNSVGRLGVMAHFKLELSRFRDLAEREPGMPAEIEAPPPRASVTGEPEPPSFPVDDG